MGRSATFLKKCLELFKADFVVKSSLERPHFVRADWRLLLGDGLILGEALRICCSAGQCARNDAWHLTLGRSYAKSAGYMLFTFPRVKVPKS